MKRSAGRVAVMTFDLGSQVAVGMRLPATDVLERCYGMRESVEEPYGPSQVRAAVRRLLPKFRAFLAARANKAPTFSDDARNRADDSAVVRRGFRHGPSN